MVNKDFQNLSHCRYCFMLLFANLDVKWPSTNSQGHNEYDWFFIDA